MLAHLRIIVAFLILRLLLVIPTSAFIRAVIKVASLWVLSLWRDALAGAERDTTLILTTCLI